MAPPRQHVRRLQSLFGQTVLGLLQGCARHPLLLIFCQRIGDAAMHSFGINPGHLRIFLFVDILAPNRDAQRRFHRGNNRTKSAAARKMDEMCL
jgi:hypothetical protein